MSIEVMRQARNAFVWNLNTDLDNISACEQWAKMLRKNIDALNKALAVPEPAQRPWQGLTEEEIESAISDGFARGLDDGNVSNKTVIKYVRGIEAALRSKNT